MPRYGTHLKHIDYEAEQLLRSVLKNVEAEILQVLQLGRCNRTRIRGWPLETCGGPLHELVHAEYIWSVMVSNTASPNQYLHASLPVAGVIVVKIQ